MPAGERVFWPSYTRDKHVLGEVRTVVLGKYQVRALMLYEHSLERHAAINSKAPVLRGRIIGSMEDIRCTICGRTHRWEFGEDVKECLSVFVPACEV